MSAAIVIAALCLPLTALVWRLGGLWLQAEFLGYRREKNREQAETTAKQAHELQVALVARLGEVETLLGSTIDTHHRRLANLEAGKTILRTGT